MGCGKPEEVPLTLPLSDLEARSFRRQSCQRVALKLDRFDLEVLQNGFPDHYFELEGFVR